MTGVTLGHPKAVYRERLECCTVEISVAALNVGIGHQVASGRSLANVCCLCLPYQGAEVDQIPGRRLQKTRNMKHSAANISNVHYDARH